MVLCAFLAGLGFDGVLRSPAASGLILLFVSTGGLTLCFVLLESLLMRVLTCLVMDYRGGLFFFSDGAYQVHCTRSLRSGRYSGRIVDQIVEETVEILSRWSFQPFNVGSHCH